MCLDSITKQIEPVKEGYKVYTDLINGTELRPEFHGKRVRLHKWYNAQLLWRRLLHYKKTTVVNYDSIQYELGFHVFHHLDEAKDYRNCDGILVKVIVEDPICVGYQGNRLITVARRIKVVEIIKQM